MLDEPRKGPFFGRGIRVAHLIDSGGLYGAEVMLLSLVEEQVKMGIQPVIASIGDKKSGEKPLEKEARRRGVSVRRFEMTPGPNLLGAMRLIRFILTEGIDLIHSHGYKGNILLGFLPLSLRRVPMLTTIHGYTGSGGLNRMSLYESLDRFSHRFLDKTVLVNEKMRELPFFTKPARKGLAVINNGISLNNEGPLADPQGRIGQIDRFCRNGVAIGSIGRLSREKGFGDMIEALGILLESGVDARLVIIGEGTERQSLESQVARKGLTDRVLMPGYISDGKHLIPFFDFYVIASLTEGLPITLLEAMQARVPIVATSVGGIPQVIRHKKEGLLVDPKDPGQMAKAVFWAMGHPEARAEMIRRAARRVASEYSAAKMADEYMTLYDALIPS
ncbi:glycosyl transferase [Desulfoluna limicola]|uniref:Glycosyl transferase n=1 Tax=Desulfoluna limicola TaxID=2810562 RepID=A0ABM7PHP2_9BACT|nr:glycosyltransferase [Desulfoluna limicola]BCS97098.1 glycosyl transferase [Desulfoluna limicola]